MFEKILFYYFKNSIDNHRYTYIVNMLNFVLFEIGYDGHPLRVARNLNEASTICSDKLMYGDHTYCNFE